MKLSLDPFSNDYKPDNGLGLTLAILECKSGEGSEKFLRESNVVAI